jgi:oligopeptide transport system substrate-binding protein
VRILLSILLVTLAAGQEDETVLRACWGPEPQELDPAKIEILEDARYAYALFEGLASFGPDNVTPVPGLAEKWEVSPDGLEYTFHLRDAKWSDGVPITAHDVAFSWRRIIDPATEAPWVHLFECIAKVRAFRKALEADDAVEVFLTRKGNVRPETWRVIVEGGCVRHAAKLREVAEQMDVPEWKEALLKEADSLAKRPDIKWDGLGFEVVDAKTLKVRLERATPHFPALLGFLPFLPVPMHAVQQHGAAWTRSDNLLSGGPYVIALRTKGQIKLARNPHYRDKAGPDRVVLMILDDAADAYALYRNGMLDWLEDEVVPVEDLAELEKTTELRAYETLAVGLVQFNTRREQFKTAAVRRAFARAVDRTLVGEMVAGSPAGTIVPQVFAGYEAPKGLLRDAAEATKELVSVYVDPSTFPKTELVVPQAPATIAAGQMLVDSWESAFGIKVKLVPLGWTAYGAALRSGGYDMALGMWAGDYNDPQAFLEPWVSSSAGNVTGWANAEYDALLKAASAEADAAKRYAALSRAEALLVEKEAPVAPLYRPRQYFLAKEKVKGLAPNLLGRFLLRNVTIEK